MPDNPNEQENPKDLRTKLDQAIAENRRLRTSNAVHEAGLTHLNEAQRNALGFQLGDNDVTADNLKAAAAALNFPLEVTPSSPPTPDPSSPPDPSTTPPNPTPPTPDPNAPAFLRPMPNSDHPDPREAQNASITGLTEMEYAAVQAARGGTGTGSFKEALGKASSKEETLAVIRQQGKAEGLLLESDLV